MFKKNKQKLINFWNQMKPEFRKVVKISGIAIGITMGIGTAFGAGTVIDNILVNDVSIIKFQQKYEQATEVKAKYQIDGASLKRTAKDDPRDRIEITIGNKDDAEFSPYLKIARWDGEVDMVIKPKGLENIATKDKDLKFEGDKIKFETPKIDYHLYELTEGEGGYEFEGILKEKPATNVIEFTLEAKGLDFFYQPSLTEEYQSGFSEEFKREIVVSETQVKDLDGNVLVEIPENVVGSYAIYTSEQKTNWVGGKLYRTGKVGHIYRPQITDKNGTKTWGVLNISGGTISITIDPSAVYPIMVDPTFGYTTSGTGTYISIENNIAGSDATSTATGVGVSITAYIENTTAAKKMKTALYNVDNTLVENGVTNEIDVPLTVDWLTMNFGTPPIINIQTYVLAALGSLDSGNLTLFGDRIDGYSRYIQARTYADGFPNPASFTSAATYRWDIYVTYSSSEIILKPNVIFKQGVIFK